MARKNDAAKADPDGTKLLSAAARKQRMLKSLVCGDKYERAARRLGAQRIAGVDEVGRGALFGPVVAAAVVLPQNTRRLAKHGLKDSKQLAEADRERLAEEVYEVAIAISIAEVDAATIDCINIYQASRRAMLRAVQELKHEASSLLPDHLLIDAMRLDFDCPQTSLFYGDALSLSIAAASVVAKVHRDRLMRQMHADFPQYGLPSHKGYGTPQHLVALREHGPCSQHRRSFAPVAQCLRGELIEEQAMLLDEAMLDEAMLDGDLLDEAVLFVGDGLLNWSAPLDCGSEIPPMPQRQRRDMDGAPSSVSTVEGRINNEEIDCQFD